MDNFWTWFIIGAIVIELSLAAPTSKDLKSKTKKGGAKGGFYSSRFGSVYEAKDFADDPTTAAPLREAQVPIGVPGPHQQNIDEDIKSEVNLEELTTPSLPTVSEDLHLGVKGGIKGAKNPPPIRFVTESPSDQPIRITIAPNEAQTIRSDIDVRSPLVSDSLTKKKTKTIKGGKKGYNYDVNNIRDLFKEEVTERPVEVTTVESYNPSILNLPTEHRIEEVTAVPTENYQQETIAPVQQTEIPVQQTEIPVQQTEIPVQQTEIPVQQTEIPVQQTEIPVQQTEIPVQQTEEPIRETEPTTQRPIPTTLPPVTTEPYEPLQETQAPIEPQVTDKPELPPQTTVPPTTTEYHNEQQTEIPQVTQQPEEPYQVTTQPPDEFSKYPLGMDGSLPLKGEDGFGKGKGKGGKGWKGSKGGKGSKGWKKELNVTPSVAVLSRGASGVSSRRAVNPATPLLPSLRGYEG